MVTCRDNLCPKLRRLTTAAKLSLSLRHPTQFVSVTDTIIERSTYKQHANHNNKRVKFNIATLAYHSVAFGQPPYLSSVIGINTSAVSPLS